MIVLISWFYLLIAVAFEIIGFVLMKYIKNIVSLETFLMLSFYSLSFLFCTLSARKIELSIIYAVWCAVGTSAVAVIDILVFGESNNLVKTISFGLVIIGIIGLVLNSNSYK